MVSDGGSPARPAGAISLSEAIAGLRDELLLAWSVAEDSRLRFKPAPVELTVQLAVTSDKTARAGVRWWLLDAGGEASRQLSATQTVKLVLDPVLTGDDGRPVEFFVADVDEPGRPADVAELSDAD